MSEHYFTEQPSSDGGEREVAFEAYGRSFRLLSAASVFAGDRLDLGTRVLFRRAPLPTRPGTFLDLGCGYGPIACVLASQVPGATVWGVDVNRRAVELTNRNAERLGLADRLRAVPTDEFDSGAGEPAAEPRFDQIWSNPPIRIGKAALHELLAYWLGRLAPDGEAWLVVGKNLGADSLQRWLSASGWSAERVASAKGFRVLRVAHS